MSTERIIQPLRKSWSHKQKKLHKRLILEHREVEVLWWLGLGLAVHHPEHVEKSFVEKFKNNLITVEQAFSRALVCGGVLSYSNAFHYRDSAKLFIDEMRYFLHIKIDTNMYFKDLLKLERCFDLSLEQRRELVKKMTSR